MKKLRLMILGAALAAAMGAQAQTAPSADMEYGPDFWFTAYWVHGVGAHVLDPYGLSEAQKAAFVEEFERVAVGVDRQHDQRRRGLCNFRGTKEGLEAAIHADIDKTFEEHTVAAAELKPALDEATLLALAAFGLKVPTMRPQGPPETIVLNDPRSVEEIVKRYCKPDGKGGK